MRTALFIAMFLCCAMFIAAVGAKRSAWPRQDDANAFTEREIARILQYRLPPLPTDPTNRYVDDDDAAHFGQFLFFDKRMSANGAISCATCHDPRRDFTDGAAQSVGLDVLERNSMSLINVGYSRWFFWDGRADTLWSQALVPMEHPKEFGGNRLRIVRLIHDDADLRHGYERIFGPLPALNDPARFPGDARPVPAEPDHPHHAAWMSMAESDRIAINEVFVNLGKALAAYQRRLVVRNSPFDRFVEEMHRRSASGPHLDGTNGSSQPGAGIEPLPHLSPAAQRGLRLFIGVANCRSCHSGPNFSDDGFHNNGFPAHDGGVPRDTGRWGGVAALLEAEFTANSRYSDDPEGPIARRLRFLNRAPVQWGRFRTPPLRNVARTAPYMHAGQKASLREVLHFYSTLEGQFRMGHQHEEALVPLNLNDSQIEDLTAFLESLTGEIEDESLLVAPASPCR